MRPPRPLPATRPFLTLFTMAFRRPQALARNFRSVATQTAAERIEQIVLPDHVGYGWEALYGRIGWYAQAARGEYVGWLNDDDELADTTVVERLERHVAKAGRPELVIVSVLKGGTEFPQCDADGPPIEGEI